MKKVTSTIAGASALLTVFGFLGKMVGLVRESLFANYFGLSVEYDLYLVAVVFPVGINTVILYITQNYFIPNYHSYKVDSETAAWRFSNTTFWLFCFSSIILTLLLFIFSEPIIELYLQSEEIYKVEKTLLIFRMFLTTIPLNAVYSVLASLLQCKLKFEYPILSQILLNIVVIIIVLIFQNDMNIYSLPLAYIAGYCIQVLYLFYKVRKLLLPSLKKFLLSSKFAFLSSAFIFLIIIEILGQTYSIIDRYFFNKIDQGGIAALNYAFILFNLPISIISFALATVLFPTFSKLSGEKSYSEISDHLKNFISINLFIFIPITIILIFYGDFIVKLIFEHGEFRERATSITHGVLIAYSISYIFITSYSVLNKLFYSLNKVRILFLIVSAGILIKIALSSYFVSSYKQIGLALTTSITYMFLFLFSYISICKQLKFRNVNNFLFEVIFSGINGILSYYLVSLCRLQSFFGIDVITDFLKVILFIIFYIITAYLIKHKSIAVIFDLLNRITGRGVNSLKRLVWMN